MGSVGQGRGAGSRGVQRVWREPARGQRGWGWPWGAPQTPAALSLVVSLTCKAPPRDPNQCELVDRPRYRKGPHICFDYNATVCGVRGGGRSWGGPGEGWGQWVSPGWGGVVGRAMGVSPGEQSCRVPPEGNWGSGCPRGGEQSHGVSP